MFTDIILREPQAYKCGLRLASLSEDKDKNLDLPEGRHLRQQLTCNLKLVILSRVIFKSCFHIIVGEYLYHEKCFPVIQQNIHISAIRKVSPMMI